MHTLMILFNKIYYHFFKFHKIELLQAKLLKNYTMNFVNLIVYSRFFVPIDMNKYFEIVPSELTSYNLILVNQLKFERICSDKIIPKHKNIKRRKKHWNPKHSFEPIFFRFQRREMG